MEIPPIQTSPAMAALTRQLQTTSALQTAVMKQMAGSQQQMAEMLQALGIGQNIDIQA